MIKNVFFSAALILLFAGAQCRANGGYFSPIGLSLWNSNSVHLGFPGPQGDVVGLRLNAALARNYDVYGIDVGLLQNVTMNNFAGIEVGGFGNLVLKSAVIAGLQLAGFRNQTGSLNGLGFQVAGIRNDAVFEGYFVGAQVALFKNLDMGHIYGFQIGLINKAKSIAGFQVGLYNEAENLHGMQIGAWNVNNSGPMKAFPIINMGF